MTEVADRIDYPLVDADNHYFETPDCFTRHLESKYLDRTITWNPSTEHGFHGGFWRIYDRTYTFTRAGAVEVVAPPGARADFFAGEKEVGFTQDQTGEMWRVPEHPEIQSIQGRLPVMDEQRVQAIMQLPTMGVMWEHDFHADNEAFYANIRSFNRWVEEVWGFGGDNGRIFSAAVLSMRDQDMAIAELQRLAAAGAKTICLKVGPVNGRSPADRYFDPFWARVQELDVLVAFHICNSGYTELYSTAWGETENPYSSDYSGFQHFTCFIDRPITDTMAALVLGNLFGRFPGVKVVSIEHGSSWVFELLKGMDRAANHAAMGQWPGGKLTDKPSDVFGEHIYVTPFHEDDTVGLLDVMPASHVLFGSDWPHSEGIARPIDFAKKLDPLSDNDLRLIMRDNTASLLGID